MLLGGWIVAAASVAANTAGQLAAATTSSDVARVAAAASVLVVTAVLFALLQLQLLRGSVDRPLAWIVVVLGLLPLAWGSPAVGLAFGFATALVALDETKAIAALVAMVAMLLSLHPEPGGLTSVTAPAALVELTVVGGVFAVVTQLALTLDRLRRAREQLARQLVDRERERVARDLHDLMGRTLVTASLRCQALLRTAEDHHPVRERLEDLQRSLTVGQERVRAITSGPVVGGWDQELSISRTMCAQIGVDLDVVDRGSPLPEHGELLALVLRASMTRALSVRGVRRITVSLRTEDDGTSLLRVTHDGVEGSTGADELPPALASGVAQVHGEVSVATRGPERRLELRLPADPVTPP